MNFWCLWRQQHLELRIRDAQKILKLPVSSFMNFEFSPHFTQRFYLNMNEELKTQQRPMTTTKTLIQHFRRGLLSRVQFIVLNFYRNMHWWSWKKKNEIYSKLDIENLCGTLSYFIFWYFQFLSWSHQATLPESRKENRAFVFYLHFLRHPLKGQKLVSLIFIIYDAAGVSLFGLK